MDNLALQITGVDDIEIHKAEGSNSRGCEVKRHRRPQSPGSDTEDARSFELLLTFHAHFGHDDVTIVTSEFIGRKSGKRIRYGCHLVAPLFRRAPLRSTE